MSCYLILAAMILVGLAMYLVASVVITHMDSKNVADIINAMGNSFPLKRFWSRRK